jgi:hypothetical protein
VYAVGHPGLPLRGRFLAAVKACGEGAVLSHFSAAVLFGLVRWEDRYPEVTVARRGTRRVTGVRVHRTRWLEARDVTCRDAIAVTAPARTLLDLGATFTHTALRRATRQALALGLVDVPALLDVLARAERRRGASALARVLADGPAPTRSMLEDVVLDLIVGGGLA